MSSDTTVDDVLEYALRKFGLGTTTKSKYNLIEVTMDNRGLPALLRQRLYQNCIAHPSEKQNRWSSFGHSYAYFVLSTGEFDTKCVLDYSMSDDLALCLLNIPETSIGMTSVKISNLWNWDRWDHNTPRLLLRIPANVS